MKNSRFGWTGLILLGLSQIAVAGEPDLDWAGASANTGYLTNPYGTDVYQDGAEVEMNALGLGLIRMGMDSMGGSVVGQPVNFSHRDRRVDSHLAAGLNIHAVISYYAHVSKGSNPDQWKANYRWFCSEVFKHYKDKVKYYIVDNETDLRSGDPASLAVDMTRIAYEEAKKVSSDILIESPPTSNPGTDYLRQMIDLGITRYCDVIGVHNYGAQILDNHGFSLRKPWEYQKAANLAKGYPMRPVASSESGTSTEWVKWTSTNRRNYNARWMRMNWLQLKRYGYDSVLLYSLNSTVPNQAFDIADYDSAAQKWVRLEPTWSAVQSAYDKVDFANGGFEEPNNRDLEWIVYFNPDIEFPPEWTRAHFLMDGKGRSGKGYLSFTSGNNIVRRVVSNLTLGKKYKISAYTKGNGKLKALGYLKHAGADETVATSSNTTDWQPLTVEFTPTNPWVVISLEGDGAVLFDDVTFGPAVNQLPTVSITSPANGAVVTAGTNLAIRATASDLDGSISRVEFYRGSSLIKNDTTSPHSALVSNLAAGTHTFMAKAFDNAGASRVSGEVFLIANAFPSISITSPGQNSLHAEGRTIRFIAAATDADGSIKRVEFFDNGTLFHTEYYSPYDFKKTLPAGSHIIAARVFDNLGAAKTSSPVSLTVNKQPVVSISKPGNGAVFPVGTTVRMEALASDPDGSIKEIFFYVNGSKFHDEQFAPYLAARKFTIPGTYSITARAFDQHGHSTLSAVVSIVIK
jgi:hypothetical protein